VNAVSSDSIEGGDTFLDSFGAIEGSAAVERRWDK
jgi:hypothetical protein